MWAAGRVTWKMFASLVLPGRGREMPPRAVLCARNMVIKQGPKLKLVKHPFLHKDSRAVQWHWKWFFFLPVGFGFLHLLWVSCLSCCLFGIYLPTRSLVSAASPVLVSSMGPAWHLSVSNLQAERCQDYKKNWKTSHLNRSRRGLGTDRDVWKPGPHINTQTPSVLMFLIRTELRSHFNQHEVEQGI